MIFRAGFQLAKPLVQLGLWSLISEKRLSSSSSLWVVLMKLTFTISEPEVQLMMIYSYFRPFKFGIRTPSPLPHPEDTTLGLLTVRSI